MSGWTCPNKTCGATMPDSQVTHCCPVGDPRPPPDRKPVPPEVYFGRADWDRETAGRAPRSPVVASGDADGSAENRKRAGDPAKREQTGKAEPAGTRPAAPKRRAS